MVNIGSAVSQKNLRNVETSVGENNAPGIAVVIWLLEIPLI